MGLNTCADKLCCRRVPIGSGKLAFCTTCVIASPASPLTA